MLLCGLDVGTSGVKAVVFDETGRMEASAYREYDLAFEPDGRRVLSAANVWAETKNVLAAVAAKAGGIEALAVTSFGEAFVLLDERDSILTEIMVFTDRRGEEEFAREAQKTSAREIAEVCGLSLSPAYSISKVLFLRENYPEVYARASRLLLIEDFIGYMLSGVAAVDYSVASRTMFFDAKNRCWSDTLLNRFGIPKELLSTPVPMGTPIGEIRPDVAAEIGFRAGTRVVAGGHDQPVCGVGAGLAPGAVVCSMGTSECTTPFFEGMLPADFTIKSGFCSEPVWRDDLFCTLAYNPSSGLAVHWFLKTYAAAEWQNGKAPFALFEQNFPKEPTKIMMQPYLAGSGTPYLDPRARLGMAGVDLGTTRYHLYRALLEGLALDQALNMEQLAIHGIRPGRIVCVGGGSSSRPWLRVKADVTQLPVSTMECGEAGALGCAALSAYALGVYGSVEEAARNMSRVKETIEPDAKHADFYKEKFGLYQNLRDHLAEEDAFASR